MSGNQVISLGASLYSDQNPSEMEKYNFALTTPLSPTNLFQIDAYYQDLLGNEYNIIWDKENTQYLLATNGAAWIALSSNSDCS